MQYHAIPCNTTQYHAILCIINNCWRSVPLPCGQYKAIFLISQLSALSQSQPWREVAGTKNRKSCLLSNWLRQSRVSSSVSCFRSCSWGFLSYLEALPLPHYCLQIHHLPNIFFFKRRMDQLWRGLTTLSWQFPPQKTLLCAMNVHFAMLCTHFVSRTHCTSGSCLKAHCAFEQLCSQGRGGEGGRVTLATL